LAQTQEALNGEVVSDNQNKKYLELYSKAKKQIDKTDKTKEDYEFERNQEECTFAPKL